MCLYDFMVVVMYYVGDYCVVELVGCCVGFDFGEFVCDFVLDCVDCGDVDV